MTALRTTAALFVLAVAPAAPAQTWTNLTTSSSWNAPGNWNPATVPNSSTAVVTFPDLASPFSPGTVNIASSVQAQSLSFTNTSGNYSITSSSAQTLSGV